MRQGGSVIQPSRRLLRMPPLDADVVVTVIVASVVGALVLLPLASLMWRSVTPGGELSLDAYRSAFRGVAIGEVALTTLSFAVGATALGLALGASLAYVLVRTDVPWRRALFVLAVAPLVLPGVLQTIAWIFLAAPEAGLLSGLPGMPSAFGLGGMVLVEALRLAPLAMLLVAAALRHGDPALEEAAIVAGAGRLTVIRQVTVPLLRPALAAAALLLFLRCIGTFEVPALLGIPERTWVFTSRVWLALGSSGSGPADAAAASMPLVALTVLGTVALIVFVRRPRTREAVTGRAHRQRPTDLGRWRLPVLGAVLAFVAVSVVLPLGALVWMSTQPFLATPSSEAFGRATFAAYRRLLEDDATAVAMRNSVTYAGVGALLATAVAIVVAWSALRSQSRSRHVLDTVAFLPIAVPGLVLGVALFQVFLRAPVALYGTGAALVLGYVARYLPYASRFTGAGLARLGRELEDAARVAGAGWWPTLRRITVPLAAAAVAAAWLAVFTVALTDVSLSLVLASPGNEVVGVRIWSLYESGRWDDLAALGVTTIAALVLLGLATVGLGHVAARRAHARP